MRGTLLFVALAAAACASSERDVVKQCTDDTACALPTPHCGDNFTCVGCVGDLDCAAYPTTPHCLSGSTCVACVDATQCANPTPVCDAQMHDCRTCKADDECLSRVCDVDAGACVSPDMILYAAANGADTASCLEGAPCSLAHALSLVYPLRPIVRMLPGTYGGTLAVTTMMSPMQPVTIVATGATLAPPSTSVQTIYVDNGNAVTIRGLALAIPGTGTIDDVYCHAPPAQTSTLTLRAVAMAAGRLTTQNCSFALLESDVTGAYLNFADGSTIDVERSKLSTPHPFSSSTFSIKIVNSLLPDVDLSMLTQPVAGTFVFAYDTFYGAQQSCAAANIARGISFVNDIFLAPSATDAITGTNCTFDTNVAFPEASAVGIGTIAMDPKLANPGAGDFHLQTGSPAIGAARTTGMDPAVDYAGTPRPATGMSIGAFEFKAGP